MIQQITIQIEPPAGYEATGEYRNATPGEPFLTLTGGAQTIHNNDQCGRKGKRIILRKVWAFPSWFAAGWWIKNSDTVNNWITVCEPMGGGRFMFCDVLWAFHGETFTPPTVDKLQCVR